MAKKLTTSKGNQSVAKATTTTKAVSNSGSKAATYSAPKTSVSTGAAKTTVSAPAVSGGSKDNTYTPTNYSGSGASKGGSNNNTYVGNTGSKDTSYNGGSKDNNMGYGGQQKSPTTSNVNNVNINDTLNQIKAEAQRQAEAGKTYVQNMLNQLYNSKPVQTANDFFRGSNSNPNMSPMQKSNEMFNAVKNRTATNSSYIPSNYGAGAGTGVNPLLMALLKSEGMYTPTEDRQYTTDRWTNEDDNFADEYAQNAMIGDARYAGTPNAMQGDSRYVGRTDAMLGNPRFQTNAGANGSDAYQSLQNALAQNTAISTIDNPNPDAAYIEVPAFMVDESAPRYNADGSENTTVVPKNYFDDYGTADLYAMRGDKRYEGRDLTDARKSLDHMETRPYSNPNFPFGNDTTYEDYADRMKGDGALYHSKGGSDSLYDTLVNVNNNNDSDYNGGNGKSNGGSGRSSGGSGGGYVGGDGSIDISALYDLLNQRLGEYDNNFNEMMNALLSSYNMNYGSLNDAYLEALNRLGLNYADTEALLNGNLDTSREALENDRTRALQEAYISRMMQEKNLADQLSAYGLSGGASESVMADLRNNYANNRASVEDKVQQSLRDLLQTYMQNLSDARANYNNQLLSAEQNRLSAAQSLANQFQDAQNNVINQRSNARAGAYEDLYNTLANLTMKGINYVS